MCNKYTLLLFTIVFAGCNSGFSPSELEIIQFTDKIIKQEDSRIEALIENRLERMYNNIEDRGFKPKEVAVWKRVNKALDETDTALLKLTQLQQAILKGNINEQLINTLGDSLNSLQNTLRTYLPSEEDRKNHYYYKPFIFYNFFLYPDSNKTFKGEGKHSFYSAYFKKTSKELMLLTIATIKQGIIKARMTITDYYSGFIGSECGFDIIRPYIIPKSNIVDNNSTYEATVFISTSDIPNPEIMFNGKKLECADSTYYCVDKEIEFPVPIPQHYDSSGLSKQQWELKLLPRRRKQDTLIIKTEYYIRKPCTK